MMEEKKLDKYAFKNNRVKEFLQVDDDRIDMEWMTLGFYSCTTKGMLKTERRAN